MSNTQPLHIHNAETLLTSMRTRGYTPKQTAEALYTALFLLSKGNGLTVEEMIQMTSQEFRLMEQTTVFASDLTKLKGRTQ